MSFISDGTPGRQANAARPILIQMPGAVPTGLGSGLAPSGKKACVRFRSGHIAVISPSEQLAAIAASDSGCSTSWASLNAFGEGFPRQIILSRAETAGDNCEIGSLAGGSKHRDVIRKRVA